MQAASALGQTIKIRLSWRSIIGALALGPTFADKGFQHQAAIFEGRAFDLAPNLKAQGIASLRRHLLEHVGEGLIDRPPVAIASVLRVIDVNSSVVAGEDRRTRAESGRAPRLVRR